MSKTVPAGEISIHALLAESDDIGNLTIEGFFISIHALLAESDVEKVPADVFYQAFLSTLSLRRATHYGWSWYDDFTISIHALLAESDCGNAGIGTPISISIHALLAESDLADCTKF